MFMQIVLIAVMGGLGTLCRYFADKFIQQNTAFSFPMGIVVVNIIGAVLIAVVYSLSSKQLISQNLSTIIMIGFLGAFTTFSTYCLDGIKLWSKGETLQAFYYVVGTPVIGISVCFLTLMICRSFLKI